MACFGPNKPDSRSYAGEMGDTMRAQIATAPEWYQMESQYQPMYAQLGMNIARQNMPQLNDLYQQAARGDVAVNRIQRAGDIQDIATMGPAAQAALEASDPQTAQLLRTMGSQAQSELDLGTQLTDQQKRDIQEASMTGASARGLGMGPGDVFSSALAQSQYGQDLQARRRAFASQVAAQRKGTYGDVFQQVLARPGAVQGAMGGVSQGAGMTGGPSLFNPESAYAGNLYGANSAQNWQYQQATPSTMARIGMVSDTVGSFIGSIGKGFMCWVAREVYGESSSEWWEFRRWVNDFAPRWFHALYQKYGERFAKWIEDKPRVKRLVRWWMDGRLESMRKMDERVYR